LNINRPLLVVAILLIAINLRPVMASLGPLLDLIEHTTRLNSVNSGLLTTLPVFIMGVGCLLGQPLRNMFGEVKGISLGILIIAIACASRALNGTAVGMILSAAMAGIGIAFIQTLIPAFIKQVFGSKTGRIMGLYTTGIMGGAALAAASASRLNELVSWQWTLALWAIPALVAMVVWLIATHDQLITYPSSETRPHPSFWFNARAWSLMLFFGIGTGAYTLVLAWLPPYYVELGQSREMAGDLLAGLTITEVISGLVVSAIVGKFNDRRPLLLIALFCTLAGLALMMISPLNMALPAVILMGLGIGSLFPLSLILTLDHIENSVLAGELVAFVQGGGYVIASFMPFLAGWFRGEFSTLSQAWAVMFVGILLITGLSLRFAPSSYKLIFKPINIS
jgi:CP family cyanate transporter-like MFS transporter